MGLIRRGGPQIGAPHRCRVPGPLRTLLLIPRDGSAWRCDTCFRVFYWGPRTSSMGREWYGWLLSPSRRIVGMPTIKHPKAKAVQSDDFGTLLRADIYGDEPWVAVEVVNATPRKDGRREKFWIRVPPTIWTARDGVAWSFSVKPESYAPSIQT